MRAASLVFAPDGRRIAFTARREGDSYLIDGSKMWVFVTNTPMLDADGRLLVAIPAFLLVQLPEFELRWIWYLSVIATVLQLLMNLLLLRREFRVRLRFDAMPGFKMAWMLWPDSDDGRRDGEIAVDVGLRLGVRAAAVVRERNAPLFELLEESGRLILIELGLGEEVGHRGEVEATLFLALLQQYL